MEMQMQMPLCGRLITVRGGSELVVWSSRIYKGIEEDSTMNTQEPTDNNGAYTSVSPEDHDEALANYMQATLYNDSPLSSKCCIFRIPDVFRRHNEKVYEPDVIAIGPFHHRKPSLQPMEIVKKWYLRTLLSRLNISMLGLVKGIKEFEKRARDCYQEPIDLDQNEFIEMLIIDGCFLVELFRKETISELRSMDDPIFNMACMHQFLYHDLLLLENQLPWFVLQYLFNLTMENDQRTLSLTELVLKFFQACFPLTNHSKSSPRLDLENLHIVDLIRNVLISSFPGVQSGPKPEKPKLIPCVTELIKAGVKFTKSSSDNMMDIVFTNGTFEIPPFSIEETTEPIFRNLIAFEQCYHSCEDKITSYAILMDNLINTSKDVEILSDKGIIDNWLSAEDASQYFNRLYNDTFVTTFFYSELCKDVNEYYRAKWPKWRAILFRDYLTNPWTIISLVAAFVLLVLTFLQTFYSIKQFYSSGD
ncbi:hypothetical protein FEM48_Zijuj09G0213600 [Ziziphus jujuba var. spinosa]|uniref:Uncharacterized protein n=2 Tax=Ziziphus jujuba TaxID=326968 RepID=A0A978UVD6_ZIZJJ|nr:hypothetical protein FEM48_Zijuj09G0213600 [Ziziphus jujuba var. spinosa]